MKVATQHLRAGTMEGDGIRRGSFWVIPALLTLGLWCMCFSWVEPLDCLGVTLPSPVNEIFSVRQRGFTLTSKSSEFVYSYWILHFEAASFLESPLIQLWAWVPVAPHATELVLGFQNLQRSPKRSLLGSFPTIFPFYQTQKGLFVELYCLLRYWLELVPNLMAEDKILSTDAADASLNECVGTEGKRDVVLLALSSHHEQPLLFHLPFVQEPFIPNLEQLILGNQGQSHWEKPPVEKLCHLQDRKVNLHRAAWGRCIVAPKTFSLPYCEGTCLALNSEIHHSKFECYKREVPTCSRLFQVCGPTKARLFSLMIQDDEYKMSVHHMNITLIEKCGCS